MAIYVTGLGMVSSIGSSTKETLEALCAGHSGLGPVTQFETKLRHIPVCEVKYTREQLLQELELKENGHLYTRPALLSIMAAREALGGGSFDATVGSTNLVVATTVGGVGFREAYYHDLLTGKLTGKEYIDMLDCADIAQKTAQYFGIFQGVTTVSTACSSSANAIMLGARMISNGLCNNALVGGVDVLTKFTLNGFNSLEILSPTGCRPFDAQRNGVTLGEGAAFLLLESEQTAKPHQILCTLSGYANTNDAYHQTALSPEGEGAVLSMQNALFRAGLAAREISYINAHGTGTENNDLSEGKAIEVVFGKKIPPVSSTKGATGHTLGAAGAMEAGISILSLQYQRIFPNVGFQMQMPELSFSPVGTLQQEAVVQHVLSNSFGFGGSNVSLIFSKY